MAWEVEFTDEFEVWWHTLTETEQGKVDARVGLLMSWSVDPMRELRTQAYPSRTVCLKSTRAPSKRERAEHG